MPLSSKAFIIPLHSISFPALCCALPCTPLPQFAFRPPQIPGSFKCLSFSSHCLWRGDVSGSSRQGKQQWLVGTWKGPGHHRDQSLSSKSRCQQRLLYKSEAEKMDSVGIRLSPENMSASRALDEGDFKQRFAHKIFAVCCRDDFLMPRYLIQITTAVSDGGFIPHFQVKAGETFCYAFLNKCPIMYQNWLPFKIDEIIPVPT